MKYRALFVIFEKVAKFETVICCNLQVALYGLRYIQINKLNPEIFEIIRPISLVVVAAAIYAS